MAMPAIEVLRKRYPKHRLVLLTDQRPEKSSYVTSQDVLEPTSWFDEFISYKSAKGIFGRLSMMLNLTKKIRKISPEVLYDLSSYRSKKQHLRDKLFFKWIAGIPDYRGYEIFEKPLKGPDGLLPRVEPEWKRLLRAVGGKETEYNFQLSIPEAAQQKVEMLLGELKRRDNHNLIAMGLGSKMPAKRWPAERFMELAERLLKEYERTAILILGGVEDTGIGKKFSQHAGGKVYNLAGQLTIYEAAAVLQKCVAYIGNDTGTMHLAAMVKTQCVALFSARDYPGWWEPYGEGHIILRKETNCAGCMLEVCDKYNNKCLKLITVGEVYESITKIFQANAQITQ
jgi:heptosyltransferase III